MFEFFVGLIAVLLFGAMIDRIYQDFKKDCAKKKTPEALKPQGFFRFSQYPYPSTFPNSLAAVPCGAVAGRVDNPYPSRWLQHRGA